MSSWGTWYSSTYSFCFDLHFIFNLQIFGKHSTTPTITTSSQITGKRRNLFGYHLLQKSFPSSQNFGALSIALSGAMLKRCFAASHIWAVWDPLTAAKPSFPQQGEQVAVWYYIMGRSPLFKGRTIIFYVPVLLSQLDQEGECHLPVRTPNDK